MTPESDECRTRVKPSRWWRRGEIDLATAGFLAEHLDAATASDRPEVLVDLRQVEFFDARACGCCAAPSPGRGSGAGGCAWSPTAAPAPAAARLRPVAPLPPLLQFPESPEKA